MSNKITAKILYYDLEPAPNLSFVWGQYEQNVIDHSREWYMLCFSYRWEHERKTHVSSLVDFPDACKQDPEKDFQYFRTLHSLAFQMLGLSGSQVLSDRTLKDFSKTTGVDLSSGGTAHISDDGFVLLKSNNPTMRAIDLARNSLRGVRYAYNVTELAIPYYEFEHLFDEYKKFKDSNGLKDFTDMMVELSERPDAVPRLKVCFLDEAQDLTPLQWEVAHH